MILGHIGARGGSKGVPGKNLRPLAGKPLIDWSLDQLLAHPRVDAVVVSTDDPAILAHALLQLAQHMVVHACQQQRRPQRTFNRRRRQVRRAIARCERRNK